MLEKTGLSARDIVAIGITDQRETTGVCCVLRGAGREESITDRTGPPLTISEAKLPEVKDCAADFGTAEAAPFGAPGPTLGGAVV